MKRKPSLHIQTGGRFIEEHDVRIADQGKSQVQTPFLSRRQRGIRFFIQPGNPERLQHGRVGRGLVPFGEQPHGLHRPDMGGKRGRLQLDPHPPIHRDVAGVWAA